MHCALGADVIVLKARLEARATECAKAMADYKAESEAERAKTARLKAQRLAGRRIRKGNEQRYPVAPRRDVWPTCCMSFAMKRPPRKAAVRGALEFIAAHPDGCTEAMLAAENIPASILIELVRSGFVVARQETFENEDGTTEVTRYGSRKQVSWRWKRTSNVWQTPTSCLSSRRAR